MELTLIINKYTHCKEYKTAVITSLLTTIANKTKMCIVVFKVLMCVCVFLRGEFTLLSGLGKEGSALCIPHFGTLERKSLLSTDTKAVGGPNATGGWSDPSGS